MGKIRSISTFESVSWKIAHGYGCFMSRLEADAFIYYDCLVDEKGYMAR